MTEQEKRVMDIIKNSEADVEIPESLQPENIEKMLRGKEKMTWWKNKKVYGLLAASLALVIGVGAFTLGKDQETGAGLEFNETLTAANDYEDIYECLENYQIAMQTKQSSGMARLLGGGATADMAATESVAVYDVAATGGYSDTNIRTEGVGEADIVKTDGKFLYAMQESAMEIAIIDATVDKMGKLSSITTEDGAQISEFYVKDDKVILFTTVSKSTIDEDGLEVYAGSATCVQTYDISDINNPKCIAKTEQSGFFHTSRIVGDYIYTFSKYEVYDECEDDDIEAYVPMVNNKVLAETDIYLPAVPAACQYVVVTSMNINNPDEIVDQKAVFTDYGECYVSSENIYIYEASSRVQLLRLAEQPDNSETVIRKISYKDGKLEGVAQGSVDGWVNDSFSIDEYEGNLRVVTTIDGQNDLTTNAVFVLNENLEKIGEITGIAKDERVYSARFFGDTGYFVTYKEVDPLFSVDFSDPTNPEIIGQLKIPGFSEYLHFYGDGQLLGIGVDTDAETGVTNGVKVSMFDISDPTNVTEVHTYTIEERYGSDVFHDYKAVLADYEKNMIGFSAYNMDEKYYIFSYDKENGFAVEMEEVVNGGSYMSTRGLYVGERFFVVKGNAIESYKMGTYEKIDDIIL